jgi:NADPH:quinone reductase-like Zn-dependent oxidoreductase
MLGDVMKAAVVERYGPPEVVSVVDLPDPVAGKGQVLVRVHATTLNSGDARVRGCTFPRGFALPGRLALGLRGPRRSVLGVAYSGVVEGVGRE